jgi:hypothetical protein
MNSSRPLQNPTVRDFKKPEPLIAAESEVEPDISPAQMEFFDISNLPLVKPKVPSRQLPLGVEAKWERLKRTLGTLRTKMRQRELELDLMPYWKDVAPALAIVTSLFLVIGSGFGGIALFGRLQPKIPFYYNAFTGYWEQVDKAILLVLPVIFLVSQMVILRFAYEVHGFDSRLSKSINYILSLLNLLFMVGLAQIYILIFPG